MDAAELNFYHYLDHASRTAVAGVELSPDFPISDVGKMVLLSNLRELGTGARFLNNSLVLQINYTATDALAFEVHTSQHYLDTVFGGDVSALAETVVRPLCEHYLLPSARVSAWDAAKPC